MNELKNEDVIFDDLLPCPFCGNAQLDVSTYGPEEAPCVFIGCNVCECNGPDADTLEKAKQLWNTRVFRPDLERIFR